MKFAAGILLAVTAATGGEWSFDGLEPLTSDDGRQSLTGSAAVRRGEGIVGNALYFDGRDDFLELQLTGESRPRDEMTVSFWVRPEADSEFFQLVRSPARDLCFDGGPGFGWYEVHTASGRQIYNGYAHPQRLQPEQWYHFALVYDQNALELYLDGDLISRTAAEQPGELRFSGEPWRIGGRLREDGGFFHGWLDDLKVLPAADRDFGEVKRLKRRERLKALGSESLDAYRRERMAALFGAGAAGLPYAVAVESGLTRILPAAFHPGNFQPENIDLIMDVPLEVTVELGRTSKSIKEILDFTPGTIIELNRIAGEPIDVLVNGKFVAKGEVVVIEESYGIRITEIIK